MNPKKVPTHVIENSPHSHIKMKCVICKQEITADPDGWEGGCNAQPVEDGQCCYECDINVVLPARLAQYGIRKEGS